MKLSYQNKEYECVSAEKKNGGIVIHTGQVADGAEIIYQICGDIDFASVILEGGTWTETRTDSERLTDLEEALELLLSGVTE